jgi:hypothetical protein
MSLTLLDIVNAVEDLLEDIMYTYSETCLSCIELEGTFIRRNMVADSSHMCNFITNKIDNRFLYTKESQK